MSKMMIVIGLLCLQLKFLQAQWISPGELKPIVPGGDYVLTSQQLLMECRLNNTMGNNSSELFIEKGDDFNGTTTIIDRWAVLMNETVTALNYSGTYFCWVGSSNLVGSQDVTVEYYPQPVVNLTCVKYNWDKWLRCSWDLGVNYVNVTNIDVIFLYVADGSGVHTCSNPTKTSCHWDIYNYMRISIIIFVNNTRAGVDVKGKQVDYRMNDIVKPAPVDVNPSSKTSRSVTLFWSHNQKFRSKVYRLKYKHRQSQIWQETILIHSNLEVGEKERDMFNYTIYDLHPYTYYEFRLDVRPSLTTGYWSEPVLKLEQTSQDVPATGPQVTTGSFYQQPCNTGGKRDVTVYWKEPKEEFQNGIIRNYGLYCNDINSTTDESTFKYIFRSLSCDITNVVQLYAKTDAGWSTNKTQIIIPTGTQDADDFYVILSDRYVQANWKLPESNQAAISHFIIYWCHGTKLLQACDDRSKLEWLQVPTNETTATLPLHPTDVDRRLFGISATVNGTSSGIYWAQCIVENIAPTSSPVGLQVEKTTSITSLKLKWPSSRCMENDQALITQYRVCVAKVTTTDDERKGCYTFNLTTNEHVEHGLLPGSEYSFQIQALSDAGHGPLSEPINMIIPSESVLPSVILAWILTPLLVLLFITVFCVVYCNRHRIKTCATKRELITLPKMSPTHEPLKPEKTSSDSSFDYDNGKTAVTEEYTMNSSATSRNSRTSSTSNSTDSSSNKHQHDPDNFNQQQESKIHLTADPDMIEVQVTDTFNPSVTQGIGPCGGLAKPEDLWPRPKDYSLFSGQEGSPTGKVQHPDYELQPISPESNVVVAIQQPCDNDMETTVPNGNNSVFHSDYVTQPPTQNNIPAATVMHEDYVTPTLVSPAEAGASASTSSGSSASRSSESEISGSSGTSGLGSLGSRSRTTSDSVQSYVKADLGTDETPPESPIVMVETPPNGSVLEPGSLPSAMVLNNKGSDYVSLTDIPVINTTKL